MDKKYLSYLLIIGDGGVGMVKIFSRLTVLAICFLWFSGFSLVNLAGNYIYAGQETIWEKAAKNIVRVVPSAFLGIPEPVLKELNQRGCMIPQAQPTGTEPSTKPQNIISGEFQKPGQTDWAVLCSIGAASTILIFWNGSGKSVEQLGGFSPDQNWLQGGPGGSVEYSRLILPANRQDILKYYNNHGEHKLPTIDHQGIEHIYEGKSSTLLYWYKGNKLIFVESGD